MLVKEDLRSTKNEILDRCLSHVIPSVECQETVKGKRFQGINNVTFS